MQSKRSIYNTKNYHQYMQILQYIDKQQYMQAQNEFFEEKQQQTQYFTDLLSRSNRRKIVSSVQSNSNCVIDRTIQLLFNGSIQIAQCSTDISNILNKIELTEQEKIRLENKRRLQQKKRVNTYLQRKSQSNKSFSIDNVPSNVLPHDKHKKMVLDMMIKEKNLRERLDKIKQEEKQSKQRSKSEIQKILQTKKIKQMQVKKQRIRQNLKRMRQKHEELLIQERQSIKTFKEIYQKKKLHQKLKEHYEQNIVLPIIEENKYKLKNISDSSKLDVQLINNHEQIYLAYKDNLLKSKQAKDSNSQRQYHPLPHSSRINKILEEESANANSFQIKQSKIKENIARMIDYTTLVRQKSKHRKTITIKTMEREEKSSLDKSQQKKYINRTQLGNQYLKLARKRAKTQPRYEAQIIQIAIRNDSKPKEIGIPYLSRQKRQNLLSKMKRQQIQKILDCKNMHPQQKMKRVKQADDRLKYQLQRKQTRLKKRYNTKQNEQLLSLLLTTIKAKINLLDIDQISK